MNMGHSCARHAKARLITALLIVMGVPSVVHAQANLNEGEHVRVWFLNSWIPGNVVRQDGNRWAVEFEFATQKRIQYFDRDKIRKLCEVDAMDYARTWESADGSFTAVAALRMAKGDQVLLIREDMEEIEIPLDRLSGKDVDYVKKMVRQYEQRVARGEVPAITPRLPEIEEFNEGFGASAAILVGNNLCRPLGAIPEHLSTFRQSGVGFLLTRKRQQVVAVIPVGGPDELVLLSTREDNFVNQGTRFQSQLYWVSLKAKKLIGTVAITPEEYAVDYDPRTRLLLSVALEKRGFGPDQTFIVFTLWRLELEANEAQPLQRWYGSGDMGWKPQFAKIINDRLVVAKTVKGTYTAWNVQEKAVAYQFKSGSFLDAPATMTFDRRHLIVPEDGKVTVVDAESGEPVFYLPVPDGHVSCANINPAGNRLVALTERGFYVWDLATERPEPKVYSAPMLGSPFTSQLDWVNDDLILVEHGQSRVLYRLSLSLPVWSYQVNARALERNLERHVNFVLNGLCFYLAKPDPFDQSVAVGVVELPGPGVEEITSNIDRDSLWVVKPGARVAIEAEAVSDPLKVQEWLKQKIEANGWIYDPQAEIKLYATMGTGATRTETYREFGIGLRETTVSYTPHFAKLVMKKGELTIWQSGTSTGAPPVVFHGGDLQSHITEMQVPQLEFFRRVKMDQYIIDPKYSRGFGVSKLSLRGLEVISTSPPGPAEAGGAEPKGNDGQERPLTSPRKNFP